MRALNAADIVRLLDLAASRGRRFSRDVPRHAPGGRPRGLAAIYFLLAGGERSHWHRIDAAELWHFYAGAPLVLEMAADEHGQVRRMKLGPDIAMGERPQGIVPAGHWQAAESMGEWTLVGCTVAPGFDFASFDVAPRDWAPHT